jgi:AAA domain
MARTSAARTAHTPKTFTVNPWPGDKEGEKILLYGKSGVGKTTAAAMSPNPIFIGLDDGGRKIRNPKTNQPVNAIQGIESFQDLRDALHQSSLFPSGSTIVIDTITRAEALAEPYLFATLKTDKGETVDNIEGYGYGKGYKHLLDAMRLILSDLEPHVRRGVNVLLLGQLAQATVSNLEGTDYLEDGPKLSNAQKYSVRTEVGEWVDHIFRIGNPEIVVAKANKTATKGKASGSTERIIFTTPRLHFMAKNRVQPVGRLPEAVSFSTPDDDAIWQFLFNGATVAQETA